MRSTVSLHALKVSCNRITYSIDLSTDYLQQGSPSNNPFEEVDSPNLGFELVKSNFYVFVLDITDLEINGTNFKLKTA